MCSSPRPPSRVTGLGLSFPRGQPGGGGTGARRPPASSSSFGSDARLAMVGSDTFALERSSP